MKKPIGKIASLKLRRKIRRKLKIRKIISGTSEVPRICVTKTNKNFFVQVIDDTSAKTLLSVQSFGKNGLGVSSNKDGAKKVGEKVAEGLKGLKLNKAVFDRSGSSYHGVIATLADTIRENGITI